MTPPNTAPALLGVAILTETTNDSGGFHFDRPDSYSGAARLRIRDSRSPFLSGPRRSVRTLGLKCLQKGHHAPGPLLATLPGWQGRPGSIRKEAPMSRPTTRGPARRPPRAVIGRSILIPAVLLSALAAWAVGDAPVDQLGNRQNRFRRWRSLSWSTRGSCCDPETRSDSHRRIRGALELGLRCSTRRDPRGDDQRTASVRFHTARPGQSLPPRSLSSGDRRARSCRTTPRHCWPHRRKS